jgi:hypothetical protein
VTDLMHLLLWWPALATICVAAWPHSGIGTVVGIGAGLIALGLLDFGLEHGRRGRTPLRSDATTDR